MIHDEFEDSGSSKDGDDELIIKPPQSSSELDSVSHHKDKKKRRHSKESESNKRHHHHHHHRHHYHHSHHHKSDNLKSSNGNSSNRDWNRESRSFQYRGNKEKDQKRESENNLNNQGVLNVRSKSLTKYNTKSDRERIIKYDEISDVRDVRLMKNIKESRRYSDNNKEKNAHFFEEMKVEWRKKRLQWLQNQKNADGTLCIDEKVSSEDENMNYEEYEKSDELDQGKERTSDHEDSTKISDVSNGLLDHEKEHINAHEDDTKMSDVSNGDNDKESASEESMETRLTIVKEKCVSHKENLTTESPKETEQKESKKKTLNRKPAEENAKLVISGEISSSVKRDDERTPKRPVYCPAIQGCRSIYGFNILNRIEEGTYGVVYRARDKETQEIVALKRLKMEREKEGFPITSLREINTLLKAQHPNIVTVREIVVGNNMDKIYIVMDYVEHDLKSLMKTMPRPFLIGEVKTLMMQLLCAVEHLHDNWILHRDLKTSNLLLSHEGILKVGDFGLAREYGSPLKSYTPVVVTLWYRAPELLLGAKKYSTPIDMWSVGCIFGELLTKTALFPGKSESDQINRIFKDLGTPNENIWPGYNELPLVQSINITQYPYNNLKSRFSNTFTDLGFDLLNRLLTYNPARRISAEKAKSHAFFDEKPKPVPPNMFPTWPAKSERQHRTARSSPKPPLAGINYSRQ